VFQKVVQIDQDGWDHSRVCSRNAIRSVQYAKSDEGDNFGRNHSGSGIPNVFLENLPGTPPDRDIEFLIELPSGTPPISKRPYRMLVNELVELKKQIAEL
jgi:hypothetical protein